MNDIIDACNHTIVQFVNKPVMQGSLAVASVQYDTSNRPVEVVYNLKDGTQQTVVISYDTSGNPIIAGVLYVGHSVNLLNATLENSVAAAPLPPPTPAIVDILLSNDTTDETSAPGTVIGTITPVGGTSPFGYTVDLGSTYFETDGDQLKVRSSVDNLTSPQTIVITVQDTNLASYSKQFDINLIDNPVITDILISDNDIEEGSGAGTLVGTLSATGGTGPFTYAITSDPDSKFQIAGDELQMQDTAVFDEAPYSVTIQASDSKTRVFTKTLEIDVIPFPYASTIVTQFNGVDERCRVTDSPSLSTQGFTVSAWVNLTGNTTMGIFEKNNEFQARVLASGQILLEMVGTGTERKRGRINPADFPNNDFFHLTLGYDPVEDKLKTYVNGTQPNLTSVLNTPFTQGRRIGTSVFELGEARNQFFNGKLDEVSYWDKCLTQAEVQELYNNDDPYNIKGHSAYDNLVSWWKMGEGASAPVIPDEISDNDINMINMDNTNFVERSPYENFLSTSFNGIDESVNCGNISIVNNLSAFCWVKFTDASSTRTFLSKYSGPQGQRAFRFYYQSGSMRMNVSGDGSSLDKDYLYSVAINDGDWHYVGFTFENDNLKFYLDGVEVNTSKLRDVPVPTLFNSNFDFQIGQWSTGANRFIGNIDEVTIWDNLVLDATDVQALYNNGIPIDPADLPTLANLAHHYRMGDGSVAPTINDEIGSNPGTMVNMDNTNFVGDVPS